MFSVVPDYTDPSPPWDNSTLLSTAADYSEGTPLPLPLLPLLPPQPDSRPWENSDPFFTARSRVLIQRVLKCYIRQAIVFLGMPCNAVSCLVFYQQGLSDKINLLLFWLSVTDLTNLTAQLWLMPGCYLKDTVHLTNLTILVNTKLGYINWWISYSSTMVLQIVSVDRCLSVALPFKAKTVLSYRVTVAAIVIAYLFPLIGYLPMLLAFTVRWRVDPSTNRSIAYVVNTDWFPMDAKAASRYLNRFALTVVPSFLLLTIVCCTITVIFLRRASRHRQQMVGTGNMEGGSRDNRITKMLLLICCIYIILAFPSICSNLVTEYFPDYYVLRRYHNTYMIVLQFLWVASCTKSAVNFFVYFVLSSRYRKILKGLFYCIGSKPSKRHLKNTSKAVNQAVLIS